MVFNKFSTFKESIMVSDKSFKTGISKMLENMLLFLLLRSLHCVFLHA